MGFRCSLFGHDYGEPFVERDREERGNEVVVTERELTECARCGAEKVTSQNTEVRSLETDRDAGRTAPDLSAVEQADATPDAKADASPDAAAEPTADPAAEPTADPAADASPEPSAEPSAGSSPDGRTNATPAVESDDSTGGAFTSASDAIEQAEAGTAQSPTDVSESNSELAEPGDDAVIMDDSTDDGPGSEQWGEHSEPDPEHTSTPEPELDEAEREDVEFIGSSTETSEDADRAAADAAGEAAGRAGTDSTGATDEESTQPTSSQPPEAAAGPGTQAEPHTDSPTSQPGTQSGGGAGSQSGTQSAGHSERGRGEWPDHEGEDEGFDATTGSTAEDVSFQFGEDAGQEVAEPTEETGFTSVGSVDQSGSESLDYAIYCPECGFDRAASGSSLRAGDICPECQRGYLAEDR